MLQEIKFKKVGGNVGSTKSATVIAADFVLFVLSLNCLLYPVPFAFFLLLPFA